MSNHVVLGAGPVCRAIVQSLNSRQIDVTVVSRKGTEVSGARSIAASVLDTDRLKEIVAGAGAVYQACQPEYHRWPEEFPAMHESLICICEPGKARIIHVAKDRMVVCARCDDLTQCQSHAEVCLWS